MVEPFSGGFSSVPLVAVPTATRPTKAHTLAAETIEGMIGGMRLYTPDDDVLFLLQPAGTGAVGAGGGAPLAPGIPELVVVPGGWELSLSSASGTSIVYVTPMAALRVDTE